MPARAAARASIPTAVSLTDRRERRLIFREVHRRVGGPIDDPIGARLRHHAVNGGLIGDIEIRTRLDDDLVLRGDRLRDRTADLAAAAEHEHSHGNFSISAKLLPRASLTDSAGATPGGSGHRMPSAGSSHAKVRSSAGL